MRTVWLGGDKVTRGVFRVARTETGDQVGLGVVVVVAFAALWASGSSTTGFLIALAIACLGALVCIPWEFLRPWTGGLSLRSAVAVRVTYRWRARHGLTAFEATPERPVPAGVGSLAGTNEASDEGIVGVVEPARSVDRGSGRYFVTVVESQGDAQASRLRPGEAWSNFLEAVTAEDCPVSHVSQVSSVTDWDPTDHVWLTRQDLERVNETNERLIDSYAEVIDTIRSTAATRRSWVVLRFPMSSTLREEGSTEDAMRAKVADETVAVIDRARVLGLEMRPLDCTGVAALCRHIMDPEVSPDDTRGLGDGESLWLGAFPNFTTSEDKRALIVEGSQGKRWMTTWEIPAWAIAPGAHPADFLYPAVTALSGRINRTFVVTAELVSSVRARKSALEDYSSDLSAIRDSNRVSDGTNEVQVAASQVRVNDLQPGTRATGVRWSMAVTFHAHSEKQWHRFERRLSGALTDSQISETPLRFRYRQDNALGIVMPFARAWRKTLLEKL